VKSVFASLVIFGLAACHTPPSFGAPPVIASPDLNPGTCSPPIYPPQSRRAEESGRVRVEFRMSSQGEVLDAKVIESSGHPRLDQAAVQTVMSCKGRPGTKDGVPIEATGRVEYTFEIQ
jgi:TonB family protein